MRNLMAIDPGLQGTGIAIWRGPSHVPHIVDVLKGPRGGEWMDRVEVIASFVREFYREHSIGEVVCEMMEFHGTARSMMSWHGDLQRTLILIGSIHGRTHKADWRLTPPSEWKGQLPKSVTIHRVQKAIGLRACHQLKIHTHAWDAVGIGLWHRGVIK